MAHQFTLKVKLPASPQEIYDAWLSSEAHTAMTGGGLAIAHNEVDMPFAAHNAYLWGKNLELIPNQKIVQSWRTTGFKSTDEDSQIEVSLQSDPEGTLLTLTHSNLPDQEVQPVEQGWVTHYFEPMKRYFESK